MFHRNTAAAVANGLRVAFPRPGWHGTPSPCTPTTQQRHLLNTDTCPTNPPAAVVAPTCAASTRHAARLARAEGACVLQAVKDRTPNHGLAGPFYSDPGTFVCDLEQVWYKEWIFVGHDCEISDPGMWFTVQIGAYPIVIVRGKDRVIRAFHNVCRHRGFKVCSAERGQTKRRLSCPYHQWTYNLDGSLAFARDPNPDLDRDTLGLKPVAVQGAGGYLFVCVSPDPPVFSHVAEALDRYLGPFDIRHAKVAHEYTITEKGNWKAVWENNRECFHCRGTHPELVQTFPDGPAWLGTNLTPTEAKHLAAFKERCKVLDLPSEFIMSKDFQYRLMRLPLTNEAASFTSTGKPAVATKRLGRMPLEEVVGDVLLYHYPSTWNHLLADHALSFRVLPLSATETQVTTKWLVPADAVEGVDYDFRTLTEVWEATNRQDQTLVEINQVGMSSPQYTPGPLSYLHEEGVREFLDWYCSVMQTRLNPAS